MKIRVPRPPEARAGTTATLKPAFRSRWENASSLAEAQTASTPLARRAR